MRDSNERTSCMVYYCTITVYGAAACQECRTRAHLWTFGRSPSQRAPSGADNTTQQACPTPIMPAVEINSRSALSPHDQRRSPATALPAFQLESQLRFHGFERSRPTCQFGRGLSSPHRGCPVEFEIKGASKTSLIDHGHVEVPRRLLLQLIREPSHRFHHSPPGAAFLRKHTGCRISSRPLPTRRLADRFDRSRSRQAGREAAIR
jgi:hypothetical protein